MTFYYYVDNNETYGPYNLEELKDKRLTKSHLVWCDGMDNWAQAGTIEELNSICISVPPPIPLTSYAVNQNTTDQRQPLIEDRNFEFDLTYEKELDAILVGVIAFIAFIVLNWPGAITFETEETHRLVLVVLTLVSVFFRFVVIIWIKNIAIRQNRQPVPWQFFAFFLPSLALIIIGTLKKKKNPS